MTALVTLESRPAIPAQHPVDSEALAQALRSAISGEVRFDVQARALYATDASNYRQVPIGVVIPRSVDDVEKIVAICRRFGAPLTNRGGGTSLAGQCCNVAVVVDFSKYLNRILELSVAGRYAWVEPGCVLDDLRREAGKHNLTFGPDPSTHNHNTLGGMAGNNSCGVHSVMAGRTADNIEALEVLTYDGEKLLVGETSDEEFQRIIADGGRKAEIYRGLRDLVDDCAPLIRRKYPKIPRRVSGYNLDNLLPENGFHVARALVGSEGTCVTILRLKCRLVPNPPQRVLLLLGYPDVYAAGNAVAQIRAAGPIGLEGMDRKLMENLRRKQPDEKDSALLPEGNGWLLVEFGADTQKQAEEQARALMHELERASPCPSMKLACDQKTQSTLWKLRGAGLGVTAHVPRIGATHEGWEDSAVPPVHIGEYLRDFHKLLARYQYETSLYGHFGDGCVHCRINFDFRSAEGMSKYRRFINEAADLVLSYGGSLSGEHGDGQSRAALLDKMFGPELIRAFQRFKRIWDPEWKMNPGKVVLANLPTEDMREGPTYQPWSPETRFRFPDEERDFAKAANRCVGIGLCRKHGEDVMCPSYMATREEAHSTRGRARLLFEMTRGEVIKDGWRSTAVHDALDLCLACKACKHECPVNVDMADYKAEFMHRHFAGRIRPRSAYAMGLIWWWARAASVAPGLANALVRAPVLSGISKWLGGFAPQREIPRFANPTFRGWFARLQRSRGAAGRRVLLWVDTFHNHLDPAPLKACVTLLESAGWDVEILAKPACCGRPLYAFGMLDLAGRMWRNTLAQLRPYVEQDVPIVGLEPACVTAFRDELRQMFPDDALAQDLTKRVRHIAEFLRDMDYRPRPTQGRALLHLHCHHHSILDPHAEEELLRATGMDIELLDAGCCGMAGDYGFRKDTYDISMKLAELRYLPRIRQRGDAMVVTDGYSCREQARQCLGYTPLSFPELLTRGA
jgi:FAD/FMN-containing dehydrogenase/Fe-S oxidoreductase